MELNLISLAVSVFAVSISASVAGWTIYRDTHDKGKLKVECNVAFDHAEIFKLPSGDHNPTLWAFFTITNIGRRPIAAKKISYALNGMGEAGKIKHDHLPRMISPGEYIVEKESADFALQKSVKAIYVHDSYGRKSAFSGSRLNTLKAQVNKSS